MPLTRAGLVVVFALAGCGQGSSVGARPSDAGHHQEAATKSDAAPDVARVTAPDGSRAEASVDASPGSDATSDAPSLDAGPLAACSPVPPSLTCDAGQGVDFMCAVTEADTLAALGCAAKNVVASAEVLACCPPCPGTDAGGCYRSTSQ